MRDLKRFNKLFWFFSRKEPNLNLEKDKHIIVHQTLAMGSANDVRALFKECGEREIRNEFQKTIKGIYPPAVLELFQHLLKVRLKNKFQYIKDINGQFASRNIGR